MSDLISRQAAIKAVDDLPNCYNGYSDTYDKACIIGLLEELPTAEKRGKWEEKQDNDWAGGGAWVCSECGYGYAFGAYHEAFEFNYCPNCGARMEESE